MPPTPRRTAPLLASSALAGAALLAAAAPLAAAPAWTPVHTVSGPVVAAGEPGAQLFGGPSAQGFTATSAWAAWESGGVIRAAERPAALGAWAPAVPISDAGGGASGLEVAPNLAVWQRVVGEDTVVQAAIRTDGTWAPAEDLSLLGADAVKPIASQTAFGPIVGWVRAEDGENAVVQTSVRSGVPGVGWSEPTTLSDPTAEASELQLDGTIAVWRSAEGGGSRIRAAVYSRNTGTWGTSFAVSPIGEFASEPRVAVSPGRQAVFVWVAGSGASAIIRSATLAAASVEPTPPVTLSEPGAAEPALTLTDEQGGALAAWQRAEGSGQVVEAAVRAGDTGAWSPAEQLSADSATAERPAVAAGAVFQHGEVGVTPSLRALQVAWAEPGAAGTAVRAAARPHGPGAWGAPQEIAPAGDAVEGLRLVEGNRETLALWRRSGGPVEGAAYDTLGPLYSDLQGGQSEPRVGQVLRFSLEPFDTWSPVTGVEWRFGDGTTGSGPSVQHAFAVPDGIFRVRAALTDALGNRTEIAAAEIRPFEYPAPQAPFSSQVVCNPVVAPPEGKPTGRIELSARQLLVSQRIAQAAVRRANAIERWLDAGIETRDICGGAFGAAAFTGIVSAVGGAASVPTPAPSPRPLDDGAPAGRRSARVALTAGQLLVNQRIAQAALRRLDALETRLRTGLTGGDLRDGAITAGQLAPGLEIRAIRPPATPTPPSVTPPSDPPKGGKPARLALTAVQLRINQRIAQAAVRRANGLRSILMSGLQAGHFRPGTIDAVKLAPALRRG